MCAPEQDEWPAEPSTSVAVVERVAEKEATGAVEVLTPFNEVLDPDALDTLVASLANGASAEDWQVEFWYAGYHIRIESDGDIEAT